MSQSYTQEYLKMFDTVLAHVFQMFRKGGGNIPPQMDVKTFQKAQDEVMSMHRNGVLREYFARLQGGKL